MRITPRVGKNLLEVALVSGRLSQSAFWLYQGLLPPWPWGDCSSGGRAGLLQIGRLVVQCSCSSPWAMGMVLNPDVAPVHLSECECEC